MVLLKKISKFFGEMLCSCDSHDFKYFNEKHKAIGRHSTKVIEYELRECCRCGIRQHRSMPKCAGAPNTWRHFPYKKGAIINFNKK